jgi:NADPH2:quinone reductase
MRAMVYDTDGPAFGVLRLVELPDPVPGEGEVRVRVSVSGVNPTDWRSRQSDAGGRGWPQQVPNQDGAGFIDAVGPGVDPGRIGEHVWLHLAAHGHPGGTAAELVVVPSRKAVALPDGVGSDVGAGLGVPALTAHHCLFSDGPIDGTTVLITGGAGAVGHVAVQMARHAGARVITTVSSAQKAEIAATAGPAEILDYRAADFPARLADVTPQGIDRVIDVDVAANLAHYLPQLNGSAAVVAYATSPVNEPLASPVRPLMMRNITLRFMLLYGVPLPRLEEGVRAVDRLLRTTGLVPLPHLRYPLEHLAEAHDHVRSGALGKVLIDVAR